MKIAIFLLLVSDLCSLSSDLVHTWIENNRQYFTSSENHVNYQFSKGTVCVMYIIQWCSRVYTSSRKLMVFLLGLRSSWWKDTLRTPPSSASLTALQTHSLWHTSSRALSLSFKTHRHTYSILKQYAVCGLSFTKYWLTSLSVKQKDYSKSLIMEFYGERNSGSL